MFLGFISMFIWRALAQNPIVTTKSGPIRGTSYPDVDGSVVHEFLGVPYAKPPVGSLRFEKPQPRAPWTDPIATTKYAPGCIPCEKKTVRPGGTVEEDCLYLNLWTRSLENSSLPVIVFIHGGGFVEGSAYQYNTEKFRELYGRRGIVAITIQYRLAHFGFLTLNDSNIAPNLGLWDQNMALHWVQDNIHHFGGDPKRVTIWGTSAGGSSVSQHTLSPKSQGLFAQGIQVSGSANTPFASGLATVDLSHGYVSRMGCASASNVKKCLQTKSVEDFYKAQEGWKWACFRDSLGLIPFTPMFDGDFFDREYADAIQHAPPVPTIMGLTQKEARFLVLQDDSFPYALAPADYGAVTETWFKNLLYKYVVGFGYDRPEEAFDDIYNFYVSDGSANSSYDWIERVVRISSDLNFNVPVVREAKAKLQRGFPIYAYLFDHSNQMTWPAMLPVQGSSHDAEFGFVFEVFAPFVYTADDILVKTAIQELFLQFIRTGKPSTSSIKWEPFDNNLSYLSLKPKPEMKTDWYGPSYRFWTETMRKYNFDFIEQTKW